VAALFRFIKRIYFYRSLIAAMAVQEVKKRYAGTLAGFTWTIVNPLVTVLVFWFIFSVGFKIQPVGNFSFVVVFLSGFIPWLTFSETLMFNTNAIVANPHLVKKTVFPTEILPLVNLVASLISHAAMLIVLAIVLLMNDIFFSIYNLQFFYYFFSLIVLSLGMGWLFASLNVFFRDTAQIIGVVLNMWFWLTPIVWLIDMIPKKYQYIIKLNPMYYIVDGYKRSFVYHLPLWDNYRVGIYFWLVAISLFLIGGYVFRKLKPEFPDVL